MKCVIPCAGKGTRSGLTIPKALLEINNRTLLGHSTYYWSDVVDEYVIVVSRENEAAIRANSGKASFVVQDPLRGIADALLQCESHIDDKFMLVLPDCLYKGKFIENHFEQGVGVLRYFTLEEYNKSYAVRVENGLVRKVIEKPQRPLLGSCGMGVYFLQPHIFDYVREASPSELRGEVEITDVIQNMIDDGQRIEPIWFEGKYINVTYPEDLRKAEEVLK